MRERLRMRKKIAIRPRLTIRHTGFSGPDLWQWQGNHNGNESQYFGLPLVKNVGIIEAMHSYMKTLADWNRNIVLKNGTVISAKEEWEKFYANKESK